MSYADFAQTVPPPLQAVLSIVVTAGISVGLVWALHKRLVLIARGPSRAPDDTSPTPPTPEYLIERILQVVTFGFIFLFTFTMGQFIITARSAEAASQDEIQYYQRSLASAQGLPAGPGRDALVDALENYRSIVADQEWPLMEIGDAEGAYQAQAVAASGLAQAARVAQEAGADSSPAWSVLATSVDDMLNAASDRLAAVPSRSTSTLVFTVLVLGVLSLAMTSVFLPVRLGLNLALIGLMGATYGFLFYIVVELSNPFQGNSSVTQFGLFTG